MTTRELADAFGGALELAGVGALQGVAIVGVMAACAVAWALLWPRPKKAEGALAKSTGAD